MKQPTEQDIFTLKNIFILIIIFFTFGFFQTCIGNAKSKKNNNYNHTLIVKNDSLNIYIYDNMVTKEDLKINNEIIEFKIEREGLTSEKRMIQSTNRTMWDMNKQTEIEKEIKIIDSDIDSLIRLSYK